MITDIRGAWDEEDRFIQSLKDQLRYCGRCGQFIGEPEFEPPDESVGIMGWMLYSHCDDCNLDFVAFDDGTITTEEG